MSGVDDADLDSVADAEHAAWVRSELEDEIEGLRKDAERYRWLRDRATDEWQVLKWITSDAQLLVEGDDMDSLIDQAMRG